MQYVANTLETDLRKPRLDAVLQDAVDRKAVAGVCAQIVDAQGTIYTGVAGRTGPNGTPVHENGVAMIASMTKLPVTLLALQLMEEGAFTLDTPVSDILPEISRLQVLDGWDGDTPRLRAPRSSITIRHLMTHTAGMPYAVWHEGQKRYNTHAGIPSISQGDPRAMIPALSDDPGTAWTYGIATDWLARLVATLRGGTIGTVLRDRLFNPLGMNDTGYEITPAMRTRLMATHARAPDGGLIHQSTERPQDPAVEEGGGGLYASLSDYARLLRLLLGGGALDGQRIVKPETVEMMARDHIAPLRLTPQVSVLPAVAADLDFYPGLEKSFGLGLMRLEEDAPTGRPAGSLSWAGIANTYFWIDPARGLAAVWFSQTMPFLDPDTHAAYLAFEAAIYGDPA